MHIQIILIAIGGIAAAFIFFKLHYRPRQERESREQVQRQFELHLARIRALIYDGATPESEEEKHIASLVSRKADGQLVVNEQGNPPLLNLHNYLLHVLRPIMDEHGLFYDTHTPAGGAPVRVYPLLENIIPALRRDGIIMCAVPGEHRVKFDMSFSVSSSGSKPARPGQPKRPEQKAVTRRKKQLLEQPHVGEEIEFAL